MRCHARYNDQIGAIITAHRCGDRAHRTITNNQYRISVLQPHILDSFDHTSEWLCESSNVNRHIIRDEKGSSGGYIAGYLHKFGQPTRFKKDTEEIFAQGRLRMLAVVTLTAGQIGRSNNLLPYFPSFFAF